MYPILFHFPHNGFQLRSYGAMLFIAFVISIWHTTNSAKRRPQEKINVDETLDIAIWMIIVGIICARLTFVILDPNVKLYTWKTIFAVWNGGISFDGAMIGALLAIGVYSRVKNVPYLAIVDRVATPAMIGYAIGRVGCFLNGCCYGAPTTEPWGVKFYDSDGPVTYLTPPSQPTQLYATAISLVWYAILTWRERKGRAFVGEITCLYLMLSAIERFTIEFWRAGVTSDYVHGTPFTTAQFFCFLLFAVGLVGMKLAKKADLRRQDNTVWGDKAGLEYKEPVVALPEPIKPEPVAASMN